MSLVHDRLRAASRPGAKWYLRVPDGEVYGPADIAMLCDWAAQNRIVPGSVVSDDTQNWISPEDLTELKMEWSATLSDGTAYGPFNLLAVPILFENRILSTDAQLLNKTTGKTLLVSEILKRSDIPDDSTPAPIISHTDDDITSRLKNESELSMKLLEDANRNIEALQKDISSMEMKLDSANKSLLDEKHKTEQFKLQAQATESELKKQFDELRKRASTETISADNTIRSLKNDLSEQKQQYEELQNSQKQDIDTRLTSMQDKFQARVTDVEQRLKSKTEAVVEIKNELEETKGLLDKALKDLQEQTVLHSSILASESQRESALNRQIEELSNKILEANEHLAGQDAANATLLQENEQARQKLELEIQSLKEEAVAGTQMIQDLQTRLEGQMSLHTQTQETAKKQEHELNKQIQNLMQEARQAHESLAGLSKEHEQIAEQNVSTKTRLEQDILNLKNESGASAKTLLGLRSQLQQITQLHKQSDNDKQRMQKELLSLASEKDEITGNFERLRHEHELLMTSSRAKQEELSDKIKQLEHNLKDAQKTEHVRKEDEGHDLELLRDQCLTAEKALARKQSELHELQGKYALIQEQMLSLQETTKQQTKQFEEKKANHEANTVRLQSDITDLTEKLEQQKKHYDSILKDTQDDLLAQLTSQKKVCAEQVHREKTLQEALTELQKKHQNTENTHEQLLHESTSIIEALEKQVKTLNKTASAKNAALEKAAKELHTAKSQISAFKKGVYKEQSVILLHAITGSVRKIVNNIKTIAATSQPVTRNAIMTILALGCIVIILSTYILRPAPDNAEITIVTETDAIPVPDTADMELDTVKPPAEQNIPLDLPPITTPDQKQAHIDDSLQVMSLPEIKIRNATVKYDDNGCTIIFQYGLFSSMTRLSDTALTDLEILANQLREQMPRLHLIIEGHTDVVPISTNASYSDNHALGMARANTVLNLLSVKYGLPEDCMDATSAGHENPPHSNDTDLSRRKNRTVVLYLREKT